MTPIVTGDPNESGIPISRALEQLATIESHWVPDIVIPVRQLAWTPEGTILIPSFGQARPNDWALQQIGSLLGIRFDRWFETASALERSEELTRRLHRGSGNVRLRLSQGGEGMVLRAVVTPSYSPIQDSVIVGALNDALQGTAAIVHRIDATERMTSLFVRVGEPHGAGAVVGNVIGAIRLTNSAVGWTVLSLTVSLLRLVCSNGLRAPIAAADIIRVRHRAVDIHSIRNQLVGGIQSLPRLLAEANQVLASSTTWRVDNVENEVRARLREAGMIRRHLDGVMAAYKREPYSSVFGVSQALTRHAQGATPEDRVALEELSGNYVARSVP